MPDKRLWRDASGRLVFSVFRVESEDYAAITRAVAEAFGLAPDGSLVVGLEQMFWDFRRAEQGVEFAWDIWMGLMVVARRRRPSHWFGISHPGWNRASAPAKARRRTHRLQRTRPLGNSEAVNRSRNGQRR